MNGSDDVDALLDLLAEVDARIRESIQPDNGEASSALAAPLTAIVHVNNTEPSNDVPPPLVEPVHRASLAENVVVQFLVQHTVPWNYQEQVFTALGHVRPSRWQLITILSISVSAAIWLGYVPIPKAVTDRITSTYRLIACPSPVPASPVQNPKQEQANGNPQAKSQ